MPLIQSASKQALHNNIREMVKAGHPQDQAVAAAYRLQRHLQGKPQPRPATKPKRG